MHSVVPPRSSRARRATAVRLAIAGAVACSVLVVGNGAALGSPSPSETTPPDTTVAEPPAPDEPAVTEPVAPVEPAEPAPAPTDAAQPVADLGLDGPEVRGEDAVVAMSEADATETVATAVDLTADELVEELRADDTLFVTGNGFVGFADVAEVGADPAASTLEATALRPSGSDGFDLSSRPSATRIIYLDFTGHTTVGDDWNAQYTNGAPIVSAPYDIDGNPGSFSAAERNNIHAIWERVAEDYLPFNVNVTTVDPGVDGLRRTSGSDNRYGQRMVISPSNWTGNNDILGVAFLSVFDESFDHSAFVFTSFLSPSGIAEAVAHEAGHTFGLRHDGVDPQPEYYSGHNGWAPLMGNPVGRSVTQWSRGEYNNASNTENDLAAIASYVGYAPDDAGGTSGSATTVLCSSVTQGLLGAGGDVDVYAFQVGAGSLKVTVAPPVAGSNLHAKVTLKSPGGAVVGTAQPSTLTGWSSSVTFNVPAPGRYTAEIVATPWQTAATGFTTYGSLGAYRLTVAGKPPPGQPCTSRQSAVTPKRLLDTRVGTGGYTRLRGGQQAVVQVTGANGVPHGATAAAVNITAVGPSGWGFLTAYPCTSSVPNASTVNYVAGQIVANNTIAALSPSGQLCVWTFADTDVLVDVTGWLGATGASRLTPSTNPERVVDTRIGRGGTRLPAGGTMQVDFRPYVAAGTRSVAFNLTAVGASEGAFMTAYPCGQQRPNTSVVNYAPGEARPNNVIVGLGTGSNAGKVCIYSFAATEVIVDLTGSFAPGGRLAYQPVAPKRVLDTRGGVVRPPVPAGSNLQYRVDNVAGLGSLDPDAAYVNVTAVDHPREGFVTTFNCGPVPNASTVNQRLGQANANGAIVPLTSTSRSCAWMSDAGHLIVDLNGWWVR